MIDLGGFVTLLDFEHADRQEIKRRKTDQSGHHGLDRLGPVKWIP